MAYGSTGYSSPEQYGKAQTTLQSDIYNLGALLHQMLSGNDPADTPFHFVPLPTQAQPALTELATLLMSMLEMEAYKRPASMEAVKYSLERIRHQVLESSQWQNQRQAGLPPGYYPMQSSERPPQQRVYTAQWEEQPSLMAAQIYQLPPQYDGLPYNTTDTTVTSQPQNGMAIAGFVCGIIGIFAGWIVVGLPFSIIGLVLSAVGMRSSERKGMAIAGLVLSMIGIVIAILILFVIIASSVQ